MYGRALCMPKTGKMASHSMAQTQLCATQPHLQLSKSSKKAVRDNNRKIRKIHSENFANMKKKSNFASCKAKSLKSEYKQYKNIIRR